MRSKILFLLAYFLLWVFIFEIGRLIFIAYQLPVVGASTGEVLKSLWYGARMDLSMAAYLTLPVALILLVHIIKQFYFFKKIVFIYSCLLFLVVSLLFLSDIFLFKAWGYHVDAGALIYLKNPKEAMASTAHLPVFWIVLVYLLLLAFALLGIIKFIKTTWPKEKGGIAWYLQIPIWLLIMGLFIIPLRGGFQLAPLNQSSVYFSTNNFANQAAINIPWNFMHSLSHKTSDKNNPYLFMPMEVAKNISDSLFTATGQTQYFVNQNPAKSINVIYIVWESFTEKVTHLSKNNIEITPHFNQLKKEGVYFSNIYASGDRTDKGIVAILSSFPAQPITSIVKTPSKVAKLPMLSKTFNDKNYYTSFYYGGELEFANIKAYLVNGDFKHFTSIDDFANEDRNSKWGAHDGVVMEKLFTDLNKQPQPFFTTWLTLSSHEPFETPVATVIPGDKPEEKFLNSLHYTDEVLFNFISKAKTTNWWQNSLIVITADHGHPMPATGKKIDDFKMPLLMLGGALTQKNIQFNQVGSQVDITPTVLHQLQWDASPYKWGKNLADSSTKAWAYFSFNNGFGFVQPNQYFIYDNVGNIIRESSASLDSNMLRTGKVMEQLFYQDYLDK